ncbi:hypothetical protein [Bacillus sp. REN3]|uniref:hypothetical protein n=1 Tax=Bacillus sp. REN3 TaxID=2802440 RepID=UPI001AEDC55B|nr:hypothetical protein [Bacillus sp. REN3]
MKRTIMLLLFIAILPVGIAQAMADNLTVDMHYIVIDPSDEGNIQVKHMVNYTNAGDEEYKGAGEGETVLEILLPPGAMNLAVQDETLGAKATGKGFATEKPIPPKETQIVPFTYMMPEGVPVNITLDYPIQVMQVLIPEGEGSLVIEGAKSSNAGLMQFEGKNFWLYNVEGVKAGQEIKLVHDKTNQPVPEEADTEAEAATTSDQASTENVTRKSPEFHNPGHVRLWYQSPLKKFNPHILMIVLGTILAAGIGYYSYFKWKARQKDQAIDGDKEEQLFKQLLARQTAIMDRILELEDRYSRGEVKEEEYQAKLAAYKEHLVQVKLSLRTFVE